MWEDFLGLMLFCIGIGMVIRHARYRKCDHYYLSRPLPAMWISHVLADDIIDNKQQK